MIRPELILHEQGWEITYMFENLFFPSAKYNIIIETPLSPLRLVIT